MKPPARACLFVITGPVGPYFATGSFNPISLLADPNFVRAWPGGIGECKAGGWVLYGVIQYNVLSKCSNVIT